MELGFLHVLPPLLDCILAISGICARQSGQTPSAQRRVRPRTRVNSTRGRAYALHRSGLFDSERTDPTPKRRILAWQHFTTTPPQSQGKIFSRIMRTGATRARERCNAFCQEGKRHFLHFRRFPHFSQAPKTEQVNLIYLHSFKNACFLPLPTVFVTFFRRSFFFACPKK
jgi:hypothetical protein